MITLRHGARYKSKGYPNNGQYGPDLFGFTKGQRVFTAVKNVDGWFDGLPFVALNEHGYKEFTCDEHGRVYPPKYRCCSDPECYENNPGHETSFDLVQEIEA